MALIADISDFLTMLAPQTRLLAIDEGKKTLGLALSDVQRRLAAPHSTLVRGKLATDLAMLMALCEKERVGGIVIGYPLHMDGSEGPRCQAVRAFVRSLETALDMPIFLADERMSTTDAHDALKAAGRNYSQRMARKDQVAATLILQAVLDALPRQDDA